MPKEEAAKVRRTLQLRFTLPSADSGQLVAMIKAAAPLNFNPLPPIVPVQGQDHH